MNYWVYENWTAEKKAVIHVGSCAFCNDGKGTGRNLLGNKNGKWHGPFDLLDESEAAALKTGRPVRRHRCVNNHDVHFVREPRTEGSTPLSSTLPNTASSVQELEQVGFKRVGAWQLDQMAKAGVRFRLDAHQNDRVVYTFVANALVAYIGICDSMATRLSDRMRRYQNVVGNGTNERIIGLIRTCLQKDQPVSIYAFKPKADLPHMDIPVDLVKGLEFSFIERLRPLWNLRR